MDIKTSKKIINEALNVAFLKGCFNINEAVNIIEAIQVINNQPEIEFNEVKDI